MRGLLLSLFLLFSFCFNIIALSGFSSPELNATIDKKGDSTIICTFKKSKILIYFKEKQKQYFIANKKFEKWISKSLIKSGSGKLDSVKIESVIVQGDDSTLIVVSWQQTQKYNQAHDESWVLKNSLKKIWNTSEMKEIFSVQTSLNYDRTKTIINDPGTNEVVEETASCNYKYSFSMDKNGNINLNPHCR